MTAPADPTVPALLAGRRSIRSFVPEPVDHDALRAIIDAACLAPAPHHSRPWRWVVITSSEAKQALARGMGLAWRADLARDGIDATRIDALVDTSHAKIQRAPVIVLGCLTWDGLDRYPDADRQRAEWGMALLSLGAAVENLMLAASDLGYASCWVAAPIFCPTAARDALELDREWLPHAMVLVGRADPEYTPPPRAPLHPEQLSAWL